MEKTLHKAYENNTPRDERSEYSLIRNIRKASSHDDTCILRVKQAAYPTAKDAPETIIAVSELNEAEKEQCGAGNYIGRKGYRVLGVASSPFENNNFPRSSSGCPSSSGLCCSMIRQPISNPYSDNLQVLP